jgi:AcrR family transcriptional regulator
MTNTTDRRVQKTRQILQKAIIDLIVEKGFESTKVQDILDKANVGRSTFYAHYQDKGELLHSCFEEFNKLIEQPDFSSPEGSTDYSDTAVVADFTLKFFEFAKSNFQLCKALLKSQDFSIFLDSFLFDYINGTLKNWMAREKNSSIPSEMVAHYFLSAFSGTLKWWINKDMPCSVEEIDKYFNQLAMPSIKSVFSSNY